MLQNSSLNDQVCVCVCVCVCSNGFGKGDLMVVVVERAAKEWILIPNLSTVHQMTEIIITNRLATAVGHSV